jgi:glycosyltransferase involved in cell wall biosynthesis
MTFFSRDKRTHQLFRKSWHIAAERCGIDASVRLRGFGIVNLIKVLCQFLKASDSPRFIFGASEICLYAFISKQSDVWIFTGIGRLLGNSCVIGVAVEKYLKVLYRQQVLVVLNYQDALYLEKVFSRQPILINGEGYKFDLKYNAERDFKVGRSVVFAYVGRLLKSKGVDILLQSFSRLFGDNWSLLLIGDKDFNNSDGVSEAMIKRSQLISKGKIRCAGFSKNVRESLRNVDIVISMSIREGLPFSVLDAVNAGAFLILSPVPGHLAFNGMDGVVMVERGELDQTLKSIMENPVKYLNFDRKKRLNQCNQKFGQEKIVDHICEVIKNNKNHD